MQSNGPQAARPITGTIIALSLALLAMAVLSLLIGRYPFPGIAAPRVLFEGELASRLIWQLRAPRILAAILVGAGLGVSGLVLQMLFGNPLVEPGLVGVSQGAALGASLLLLLAAPPLWVVQLGAAAGGGLGLSTSLFVARRFRFGGSILRLVLAGIAVSALFSAGVGLVKFAADPLSQLPAITFWLLGGLSAVNWSRLVQILPVVVPALIVLLLRRWRLNLLSLDDRASFSLGAAPSRERVLLLTAATALTAALISLSGIVGWVGLLTPHAARRLVGADARRALPVAALLGSTFVVAGDTLARTLILGEIPLGVVTSLIGAASFIRLLSRNQIRVVRR
ncbi:MAG: FecCD family ABC transporter permease [Spirochaetota bacterium]